MYELQPCSRGGGGNRGMAVLTTVNWRSLSNFLPNEGEEEGGVREVSKTLSARIVACCHATLSL